ncbi:hypothetical protein PS1_024177 [Malus domestica]
MDSPSPPRRGNFPTPSYLLSTASHPTLSPRILHPNLQVGMHPWISSSRFSPTTPFPLTICTRTPKTMALTRTQEVASCAIKDLPGSLEVSASVAHE